MLVLACLKKLTFFNEKTHQGSGSSTSGEVGVFELDGKTYGLLGMGRTARRLPCAWRLSGSSFLLRYRALDTGGGSPLRSRVRPSGRHHENRRCGERPFAADRQDPGDRQRPLLGMMKPQRFSSTSVGALSWMRRRWRRPSRQRGWLWLPRMFSALNHRLPITPSSEWRTVF